MPGLRHLAIIMDGNGRWAQGRGMPRSAGHTAGMDNAIAITKAVSDLGARHLTLFAFSVENWRRPADEVEAIMRFPHLFGEDRIQELHERRIRMSWMGDADGLPQDAREALERIADLTRANKGLHLRVAFNYSGRRDIAQAVERLMADGAPAGQGVTEELLASRLQTAGMPDPDLIIRTGGEFRISNFLLWQAAYAEFYSTAVLWPDFRRSHLKAALNSYARRKRRFGRVD